MYQGLLVTWPQGYLENHPRTRKWLGSPPFTSHVGHLEREQPYLGDLLTMVINHLLTGMILQVRFANDSMILYIYMNWFRRNLTCHEMPWSPFHQAGFRASCHWWVRFVAILHLFCSQTGDSWLAFCDLHWVVGAGVSLRLVGYKMGPYSYQL